MIYSEWSITYVLYHRSPYGNSYFTSYVTCDRYFFWDSFSEFFEQYPDDQKSGCNAPSKNENLDPATEAWTSDHNLKF